jgi:hypothetical protein
MACSARREETILVAAMGGTFILIGVLLAIVLAGYCIYYLIFKLK